MKIGLVGLGRMGSAISQRLTERGYELVGWDRDASAVAAGASRGLAVASDPHAVAAVADIVISIITEDAGVWRLFTGARSFSQG